VRHESGDLMSALVVKSKYSRTVTLM